jgi:hypothetical protein
MADSPSAISREDEESLLSRISSLTLGLRTGARRQVVNHVSSIGSPATVSVVPTTAHAQELESPVPATVSFQTQPGSASQDAEASQQPSIYHDASPVTILRRPDPNGSVYSDLLDSIPNHVFEHVEPTNINTTRGPSESLRAPDNWTIGSNQLSIVTN